MRRLIRLQISAAEVAPQSQKEGSSCLSFVCLSAQDSAPQGNTSSLGWTTPCTLCPWTGKGIPGQMHLWDLTHKTFSPKWGTNPGGQTQADPLQVGTIWAYVTVGEGPIENRKEWGPLIAWGPYGLGFRTCETGRGGCSVKREEMTGVVLGHL